MQPNNLFHYPVSAQPNNQTPVPVSPEPGQWEPVRRMRCRLSREANQTRPTFLVARTGRVYCGGGVVRVGGGLKIAGRLVSPVQISPRPAWLLQRVLNARLHLHGDVAVWHVWIDDGDGPLFELVAGTLAGRRQGVPNAIADYIDRLIDDVLHRA